MLTFATIHNTQCPVNQIFLSAVIAKKRKLFTQKYNSPAVYKSRNQSATTIIILRHIITLLLCFKTAQYR